VIVLAQVQDPEAIGARHARHIDEPRRPVDISEEAIRRHLLTATGAAANRVIGGEDVPADGVYGIHGKKIRAVRGSSARQSRRR